MIEYNCILGAKGCYGTVYFTKFLCTSCEKLAFEQGWIEYKEAEGKARQIVYTAPWLAAEKRDEKRRRDREIYREGLMEKGGFSKEVVPLCACTDAELLTATRLQPQKINGWKWKPKAEKIWWLDDPYCWECVFCDYDTTETVPQCHHPGVPGGPVLLGPIASLHGTPAHCPIPTSERHSPPPPPPPKPPKPKRIPCTERLGEDYGKASKRKKCLTCPLAIECSVAWFHQATSRRY